VPFDAQRDTVAAFSETGAGTHIPARIATHVGVVAETGAAAHTPAAIAAMGVLFAEAGSGSELFGGSTGGGGGTTPVNLAWDSLAGSTSYIIYWGLSTGNYTNSLDVGLVTTYTLTTLLTGTTYYLVIRGFDGSGEADASSEITVLNGVQL
jgi:hypothetical protein